MLPVGAFMLQLQSWVVVWLTEPEIYLYKKVALTSGCENWAYLWCEVAVTSRTWQLDYKETWAPKNWCFWTVVLEKTLESPMDCKNMQPVHPKGNQSQIFIGGTDAEAETPILWPPDVKNWLIGKDPDTGKDWRQGEKGMTEDEMVGWSHRLNGHEFEWTLAVGDGQGVLVCCSPCICIDSDTTEQLNWTDLAHVNPVGHNEMKDLDSMFISFVCFILTLF